MRAAIYGAGAMGTVLGAMITKNGGEIQLITRNKEHVAALNEKGARVIGEVDFTVKVDAITPDKMSGKYDIIFLMTKQRGNGETCEYIKDYLEDDGVICTLQNGLPEPAVAEVVGKERCLGCVVSWGAAKVESGVVSLDTKPADMKFSLGSYFGKNDKIAEVEKILALAGNIETEENFFSARWAKLAINSSFSAICALTGMKFGEISRERKTKSIALKLINEAFDVAAKYGVETACISGYDIMKYFRCDKPLKKLGAKIILPVAMKKYSKLMSGMYYDLIAGRKCDIDFINGVISHLGKKLGVSTPYNDKIVKLCHEAEERIARGERAEEVISRANIGKILK